MSELRAGSFIKMTKEEFEEYLTKPRIEKDPNGIDAKTPGAKLDAGKPPVFRGLLDYFPRACMSVAMVSAVGASKYSWKGWESVPDGVNRYRDAAARHNIYQSIEGPYDSELQEKGHKVLHLAQVAWNDLAALELYLREQESTTSNSHSIPMDGCGSSVQK